MNEQDSIKNNKIKSLLFKYRYTHHYFHVDVAVERINHIPLYLIFIHIPPYFIVIIFQLGFDFNPVKQNLPEQK